MGLITRLRTRYIFAKFYLELSFVFCLNNYPKLNLTTCCFNRSTSPTWDMACKFNSI